MAANFWASSQRSHWLTTRTALAATVQKLDDEDRTLATTHALPERRALAIYFNTQVTRLGRKLQIRQQAIATAQVYVARFYTRIALRRTNPYLVMATAVYLACKMEECPQHIRHVVSEARSVWPEFISSDTARLGECEFRLIQALESNLIVHHPYRTLSVVQTELGLTQEEAQTAWGVVNDSYMTDLLFLYAPHVVALAAVFLAVGLKAGPVTTTGSMAAAVTNPAAGASMSGKTDKLLAYFAASEVDMEGVVDCTQEMICLYEFWEGFNEKQSKDMVGGFVKARDK